MKQNRLKEIREGKKMSAYEIARKLGVTAVSYYRYEKGEQTISAEMLAKLADILGVSTDYILGRTNEPSSQKEEVDIQKVLKEGKVKLHWGGVPLGEKEIEEVKHFLEYVLWRRLRGE